MSELLLQLRQFFSSLFPAASGEAYDINRLFLQYMILAGIIISLVAGLVIIAAIRFRSGRRPETPPQVFGNKYLEITWTVLPGMALALFFYLTIKTMMEINAPFSKGRKPDIVVVAHQWWWEMHYPDYKLITANELHIPVGKRLLMRVESADVIHDWWVPALGRKIDAVPGRLNYNWIEANAPGDYEGTCSEYCGMQHAWMRIKVIAQPPAEFQKWIAHQQQIPPLPTDSVAQRGALLFQNMACANCHRIAGTPAESHIGPDLTHLASRETILSGMLPNTPENLQRWLKNPQKIKEGAHMPDFRLSPEQIKDLTTYLEALK
jgi:cytochrome c oxidase subunit 2